jgi:cytochrome c oxidase subunit I+III
MGAMNQTRPVLDVSGTPNVVFGHRSVMWWGQWGLMAIEGTMFMIFFCSYFYLRTRSSDWPPGFPLPAYKWGTINLALLLVSAFPNEWVKRRAEIGQLTQVRLGLLLLLLISIANIGMRVLEFHATNCVWNGNAYGSAVWTLLGFHTTHLVTDFIDTVVLTVLMFTGPVEGRRFNDVSLNSIYWYFIIVTWIPTYLVIYWAPRWI